MGLIVPSYVVLTSPVEAQGDNRLPSFDFPAVPLPPPFTVPPESNPCLWAWRKATDVERRHREQLHNGSILLGADTVVVAAEKLLGKPANREEAAWMLRLLRGREHHVVTGFVLLLAGDEGRSMLHSEAVSAKVTIRAFSEDELNAYLDTDEPYDKAGAYALQGLGGRLVESVEGCRTTVIGLPVCRVRAALQEAVVGLLPYPDGGYCAQCGANDLQAR